MAQPIIWFESSSKCIPILSRVSFESYSYIHHEAQEEHEENRIEEFLLKLILRALRGE